MYFKTGEFVKLKDGPILEILYADEEKAICIRLKKCFDIGWVYTDICLVISNDNQHYMENWWITKVPTVTIASKISWKPLISTTTYAMGLSDENRFPLHSHNQRR